MINKYRLSYFLTLATVSVFQIYNIYTSLKDLTEEINHKQKRLREDTKAVVIT